jgi:hypothetical protein
MSDAHSFTSGVAALLTGDSIFAAAIASLVNAGVPVNTLLRGNVPVAQIPAGSFPCFVVEQGDGKPTPTTDGSEYQTIGLAMTSYASDLYVSLVWIDQDVQNAAITREKLPKVFGQLFMRNPQPGGVDFGSLTEWQPDRGINHPNQIWRAVISGNYTTTKNE